LTCRDWFVAARILSRGQIYQFFDLISVYFVLLYFSHYYIIILLERSNKK